MQFFITAVGSLGDVNPYLSLGLELDRRGHEVIIMATGGLRDHIYDSGLKFVDILSSDQFNKWRSLPTDVTRGQEDIKSMVQVIFPAGLNIAEYLIKHANPETSVVMGMPIQSLGIQLAKEIVPFKSIGVELNVRRFDKAEIDEYNEGLGSTYSFLCRKVGANPAPRDWYQWSRKFDKYIALLPDWYVEVCDSPQGENITNTNFVYYSLDDERPLTPEIQEFLGSGSPPIGFTFGSYMSNRKDLFSMIAQVCSDLGVRAIFLTKYADQLPSPIPSNILHVGYVSLQQLLPKLSALVYHAGIGTASQVFKAGIPHLACPMAFDQFSNARNVENLGVGLSLEMQEMTPKSLSRAIERLLTEDAFQSKAENLAQRFFDRRDDGAATVCDEIERLCVEIGLVEGVAL